MGHIKADGKLDRNWLKCSLNDAIYCEQCWLEPAHDLRKPRVLYAILLARN